MFKRVWTVVPVLIVGIALAQNVGVQGARGEGVAKAPDGRMGGFNFDVRKRTSHDSSEVGGRFVFESVFPGDGTHATRHVRIEMARPRAFGKNGNVAEFGGPGRIIVRTEALTVIREGRVAVRVVDNRRPDDPNTEHRDVIRVGFDAANSDFNFGFEGLVVRGDIVVYAFGP